MQLSSEIKCLGIKVSWRLYLERCGELAASRFQLKQAMGKAEASIIGSTHESLNQWYGSVVWEKSKKKTEAALEKRRGLVLRRQLQRLTLTSAIGALSDIGPFQNSISVYAVTAYYCISDVHRVKLIKVVNRWTQERQLGDSENVRVDKRREDCSPPWPVCQENTGQKAGIKAAVQLTL